MGKIHARHLDELGINWDYYDPFVTGGVEFSTKHYSHIIIATPIETHFDVYKMLNGFTGSILIEKPVVTQREHLYVLYDDRIFPGLVERFNPVSQMLLKEKITSLDFVRNASPHYNPILDVVIHDVDLAFFAIGKSCWGIQSINKHEIKGSIGDVEVSFTFKVSDKKKRKCLVNKSEIINFVDQTFNGTPVNFAWPVKNELTCFFSHKSNWPDQELACCSHKFVVECYEKSIL